MGAIQERQAGRGQPVLSQSDPLVVEVISFLYLKPQEFSIPLRMKSKAYTKVCEALG